MSNGHQVRPHRPAGRSYWLSGKYGTAAFAVAWISGSLPFRWANRSVQGLGKWYAKIRTGEFYPGIAFTICTIKSVPFTERQRSRHKQLNLFFGEQLLPVLSVSSVLYVCDFFSTIFESIAFASTVFVIVVFLPCSRRNSGRYLLCYGLAKYFSPLDVDYFRFVRKAEYVKVVHEQWSMVGGLFSLDDLLSSPNQNVGYKVTFPGVFLYKVFC